MTSERGGERRAGEALIPCACCPVCSYPFRVEFKSKRDERDERERKLRASRSRGGEGQDGGSDSRLLACLFVSTTKRPHSADRELPSDFETAGLRKRKTRRCRRNREKEQVLLIGRNGAVETSTAGRPTMSGAEGESCRPGVSGCRASGRAIPRERRRMFGVT